MLEGYSEGNMWLKEKCRQCESPVGSFLEIFLMQDDFPGGLAYLWFFSSFLIRSSNTYASWNSSQAAWEFLFVKFGNPALTIIWRVHLSFGKTACQHLARGFWSLAGCPRTLGIMVIWDCWETILRWFGWCTVSHSTELMTFGTPLQYSEQLHFHFSLLCTGEGNGNPLQCSCLENPRDRGAWWAAIYGVAQSRTRLKRLSSSSSSSRNLLAIIGSSRSLVLFGFHTVFNLSALAGKRDAQHTKSKT